MPRQRRLLAQLGFDGFTEIFHEMPTVGDLHRVRCALGHPGGIGFRPIARDDCHLGMGLEPGGHRLSGTVLKQIDGAVAVQIHHDRAIGMALAFRPIVDADSTRRVGPLAWRDRARVAGAYSGCRVPPGGPSAARPLPLRGPSPSRSASRGAVRSPVRSTGRPGGRAR